MATVKLDYRGLRCPQPTLKLGMALRRDLQPGDAVEIVADCPSFEADIKRFCETHRKPIIKMAMTGTAKMVWIKA